MNTKTSIKNIVISLKKASLSGPIFAGIAILVCLIGITIPKTTNADFSGKTAASYVAKATNGGYRLLKTIEVVVTAYSSTPDQTDSTPFITASGKSVADGIVANNMLPFGTKIKIPELYGNQVFTVEDRMNKDKSNYHIDIWMADKTSAIDFGKKITQIEILNS